MIVECTSIRYDDCQPPPPVQDYLNRLCRDTSSTLPLERGRYYVVYAVALGPGGKWLFIEDGSGAIYPRDYSECLFRIVNPRVSRHWCLGEFEDFEGGIYPLLAMEEWCSDRTFHGRMFEGDPEAIAAFSRHKEALDVEQVRPDVDEWVEKVGDSTIVLDVDSGDTWDVCPLDAMVVVPSSLKMKRNPYYLG